ncbi:MAG: hypothetical protein NTZ90_11375 [Proteobacteria bacterium]|nr:hypothetical protein [Pseudomonadota bacterium]
MLEGSWTFITSPSRRLFVFVLASISFAPLAHGNCIRGEYDNSVDGFKIGPYRYESRHNFNTAQGYFSISKGSNTLFTEGGDQSAQFYINPGPEACDLPVAGKSITGEPRAELAVLGWSGGAHCCFKLYIYALTEHPFLIQKIDQGHSDSVRFVYLNRDRAPGIIVNDWTFAYWKVSFAQSPAPEVMLKYNGRRWAFAPNLMHKPPPSTRTLKKMRKSIEVGFKLANSSASDGDYSDTGAPVALWTYLIDLIYSGHADAAWSLLNDTWPPDNPNRLRFAEQFRQRLVHSSYFADLQKMNPKVPFL